MHIPTHLMSGWCVGASLPLTPRERLGCMMAASLPDLDGISLAWGQESYLRWHHVLGHNLFFGLLLSAAVSRLARPGWRLRLFMLALALFHLHLVMDYWGSGQGWGIFYLWPAHDFRWANPHAWAFGGWQNYTAMIALLSWLLLIALLKRISPFELITPGFEAWWRSKLGTSSSPT